MRVIGVFGGPSVGNGAGGGAEQRRKFPFNLVLSNKEMCDTI